MSQDTDMLTRLARESEHWRNVAEERRIEIESLREEVASFRYKNDALMKMVIAQTAARLRAESKPDGNDIIRQRILNQLAAAREDA